MSEEDLKNLHAQANYHRAQVEASQTCGCFYCKAIFAPSQIQDWIDKDQTALCPKCGIDSVLPEQPSAAALEAMHQYWF